MNNDEYITRVVNMVLDDAAANIIHVQALKRIKAIANEQADNEDRHRDRFTLHRIYNIAKGALHEH